MTIKARPGDPMTSAHLAIRALPWRPRPHVMNPDTLRGVNLVDVSDDLAGFALGLALSILLLVAAPLIVLVLAGLLLAVEVPLVLALAVLFLAARLLGAIPWTVVVDDGPQRQEERYRLLWRAVRRIRAVNRTGSVPVRWSWT